MPKFDMLTFYRLLIRAHSHFPGRRLKFLIYKDKAFESL